MKLTKAGFSLHLKEPEPHSHGLFWSFGSFGFVWVFLVLVELSGLFGLLGLINNNKLEFHECVWVGFFDYRYHNLAD